MDLQEPWMPDEGAEPQDVDRRVASVAEDAELRHLAEALAAGRAAILSRWLTAASAQPFHRERPDRAVADDIPRLFDAVTALLRRAGRAADQGPAPLEDPEITAAATSHAQVRFEQGLDPIAIVTEFRLLRQEIARALAALLDDDIAAGDVVAGLAVIGDALDGAATIGLQALSDQVEALRESLLAATLHDIRQPVTLAGGSLHLAQRWIASGEVESERIRETIDDAIAATDELVALVDTMSDASRVAMGALQVDPEPASLEALVRDAIEMFGAAARARVRLDVPDNHHLIGMWDARLIHRLVANLVGNALKYSPGDAKVQVRVETGDAGHARLVVVDRGLGMSPDELASAFERFARAAHAREQGIPGLGLGLYACRGIVRAHGGSIELRSDGHGRGTTVVVELPLLDEPTED
jgi:signal transduction histidine kinase